MQPIVRIATIRTQSKRAAKECAIKTWPGAKILSITHVNKDTFKVIITTEGKEL